MRADEDIGGENFLVFFSARLCPPTSKFAWVLFLCWAASSFVLALLFFFSFFFFFFYLDLLFTRFFLFCFFCFFVSVLLFFVCRQRAVERGPISAQGRLGIALAVRAASARRHRLNFVLNRATPGGKRSQAAIPSP